jgi:hypothetical protein
MNHQTDNGRILNKINPKQDKTSPVQKGILTTTMAAQGDTGAGFHGELAPRTVVVQTSTRARPRPLNTPCFQNMS